MKNVRVYFSKKDQAKYISHLDLMRCISRCIKKINIPVWHTEGFNPHLYITFALPLSLGYEGVLESFDIRLTDDEYDHMKLVALLGSVMPRGLDIIGASVDFMDTPDIAFAEYEINISLKNSEYAIEDYMERFLKQESINVQKKSKKKIKEVDIKPFIDIREAKYNKNLCELKVILSAGNTGGINPSLIYDAFVDFCNLPMCPMKVRRTRILTQDHSDFK